MSEPIDDIMTALVSTTRSALPGVQVLDGWNGATDREAVVLIVGYDPSVGTPVISQTVDVESGDLCKVLETDVVTCTIAAWDGNMEFATKRSTLVGHIDSLQAGLRANRNLGGVAYDTWLAPGRQWMQVVQPATESSPAFATVQCDFSITVEAFRT